MKKRQLLFTLVSVMVLYIVPGSLLAQTSFTKYIDNPIIQAGSNGAWTDEGYPFTFLMRMNDTLHMWFTASDAGHETRIGHATSTDGIHFMQNANPIFTGSVSPVSNFDSKGVFGANILYDGTTWRMWYNGFNTQPYYTGHLMTGLATSADGITWTRYSPDPVLPLGVAGSYDDNWAYVNTVLYEDGMYKMWYTAHDGFSCSVCYAVSSDGINWQKHDNNPVLYGLQNGDWDDKNVQNARVIHHNGIYQMWYNGSSLVSNDFHIGYATSTDGITWTKSILNPVLQTGADDQYDGLWCWTPYVEYQQGVYNMWYTGYDGAYYTIALATDSSSAGTGELPRLLPETMSIHPNPAASICYITLENQQSANTMISLLNSLGQCVQIIYQGNTLRGKQQIAFNTSGLPSGWYYCRQITNNQAVTRKLMISH